MTYNVFGGSLNLTQQQVDITRRTVLLGRTRRGEVETVSSSTSWRRQYGLRTRRSNSRRSGITAFFPTRKMNSGHCYVQA